MSLRIGVDIGGSFTDFAVLDDDTRSIRTLKVFSRPDSPGSEVLAGMTGLIERYGIAAQDVAYFTHGTTVGVNAVVQRKGLRLALITTEKFEDVLEIARLKIPDMYHLLSRRPDPLIPRDRVFGVKGRLSADGHEEEPVDEASVLAAVEGIRRADCEGVVISLLHSYRNPAHEQRVKQILQEELPGAFVSASHELSQEYREFERVSTVVANAYVGPRVSEYLGQLETHLSDKGFGGDFYVVQSTGGLFPIEHARVGCVRMLESGPAAGVIGAQAICAQLGMGDAIAFDMGGTTAKAGVISEGRPLTTGSALIGGYERALPIQIPMMDIHEVGTGGGSIARVETGNALRVGPQSAGSIPGPVAYGRGGKEPTVTDANLVLGRLDADNFLGGELKLDLEGCKRQMAERVAGPLGLDPTEAADGILRIAVTQMSHAVKAVTTERGLDAGSFTMVVYGGAGPLHASAIAREIGIRKVLIPYAPGYFSAYGMLFSDLRYDYVRSVFRKLNDVSFEEIEAAYKTMEDEGRAALAQSGVKADGVVIERAADMRYVGQEHAVTVDLPMAFFEGKDRSAIKQQFDELHKVRYGTSAPKEPADLVSLRVTVLGIMKKPPKHSVDEGSSKPEKAAVRAVKPVYFRSGGWAETPVYKRDRLRAGNIISGPALIEEHASTTVMQPGDGMRVDELGNLQISIGSDRS